VVKMTYDSLSFPKEEPVIRSIALADMSPTSLRSKVRALDAFCQFIMTLDWKGRNISNMADDR